MPARKHARSTDVGRTAGGLALEFARVAADLCAAETVLDVLQGVTEPALRLVDGCDTASFTFARGGRHWTPYADSAVAAWFEDIQHRATQGPSVDASRSGGEVTVGDSWSCWPGLALSIPDGPLPKFLACGLALPAPTSAEEPSRAALTLYSFRDPAFDRVAIDRAALLAAHASIAISVARRRAAAGRAEENFLRGLEGRERIGEATGVLMERQGLSSTEAFESCDGHRNEPTSSCATSPLASPGLATTKTLAVEQSCSP